MNSSISTKKPRRGDWCRYSGEEFKRLCLDKEVQILEIMKQPRAKSPKNKLARICAKDWVVTQVVPLSTLTLVRRGKLEDEDS